jgi:hypothetical protein
MAKEDLPLPVRPQMPTLMKKKAVISPGFDLIFHISCVSK